VFTYSGATMIDMHNNMCLGLAYAPTERLSTHTLVDASQHNVIAEADSMVWDADLKNTWLTKIRWSMMVRQYLDPLETMAWINQCSQKIGTRGRGTAVLRTKTVKARGGAATGHTNKESRRWGSCMLNVSYKALPEPTITLHSRTSYLGYLSVLDLTIAWMLGQYVAEAISHNSSRSIKVEDFHFVWMVESIQWHAFKSLAWLLSNEDDDLRRTGRAVLLKKKESLDEDMLTLTEAPAIKASRVWLTKVRKEDQAGLTYGEMTYNTYRRIRRRWHTEVLGYEKAQTFEGANHRGEFFKAYRPLPSCMVSGLDLSPIRVPRAIDRPGNYKPEDEATTLEDINTCLECGDLD